MPELLKMPKASIVLVQSPAAYQPVPGATAYVVSRFALRGLAEALAIDLYGTHIGVTTVVLNEISDSGYFRNDAESHGRLPWIKLALGRAITSKEAAAAIVAALRNGTSFRAPRPAPCAAVGRPSRPAQPAVGPARRRSQLATDPS